MSDDRNAVLHLSRQQLVEMLARSALELYAGNHLEPLEHLGAVAQIAGARFLLAEDDPLLAPASAEASEAARSSGNPCYNG